MYLECTDTKENSLNWIQYLTVCMYVQYFCIKNDWTPILLEKDWMWYFTVYQVECRTVIFHFYLIFNFVKHKPKHAVRSSVHFSVQFPLYLPSCCTVQSSWNKIVGFLWGRLKIWWNLVCHILKLVLGPNQVCMLFTLQNHHRLSNTKLQQQCFMQCEHMLKF